MLDALADPTFLAKLPYSHWLKLKFSLKLDS